MYLQMSKCPANVYLRLKVQKYVAYRSYYLGNMILVDKVVIFISWDNHWLANFSTNRSSI